MKHAKRQGQRRQRAATPIAHVLVGHSFGGTIVHKVAEQVPDRVARLVFLDDLILKESSMQIMGQKSSGRLF